MGKTAMIRLVVLALVCSSFLLLTSCAKKQVGVSDEARPSGEVGEEAVGAKKKTAPGEEELEDLEAREAAREAKLREREFVQKIDNFESENIYFDFDKSNLKPESKAILKDKASFLRANPSLSVLIAGNCDERGTAEYNLALGERRAHAAKKYLVALGISGDRIQTISYGEERPADPGHNPVAWALNRRDTFKIIR